MQFFTGTKNDAMVNNFFSGVMLVRVYQCRIFFIGNLICAVFHWYKKMINKIYDVMHAGLVTPEAPGLVTPIIAKAPH